MKDTKDTLIGAMSTLFTLQRWNFLPRVETWVEAENVAYVTHIGYALGTKLGLAIKEREKFLVRSILKSFNKHFLSDIPINTRKELIEYDGEIWKKLVNKAAGYTSELFPTKMVGYVKDYLDYEKSYENSDKVEILVDYAQQMAAREECKTNKKVYDTPAYKVITEDIEKKINILYKKGKERNLEFKKDGDTEDIFENDLPYFSMIKGLKYLRRWNRVNRSIESSVMSHTYIVTFLALLFSEMSEEEINTYAEKNEKPNFKYRAILRALFHDVPESLTGDLISPVKDEIAKVDKKALKKVEKKLVNNIIGKAPPLVKSEIENYHLLEDIDKSEPHSVASMVKDCDMLALVLECLLEKLSGRIVGEMLPAYSSYLNSLQNSEWSHIREFCTRVSVEFPNN